MSEFHLVQKDVTLELSQNLINVVSYMKSWEKTDRGVKLIAIVTPPKYDIKNAGLEGFSSGYSESEEGEVKKNEKEIIFEVISDKVLRIKIGKGEDISSDLAVIPSHIPDHKVTEDDVFIYIKTNTHTLEIRKKDCNYELKSNEDKLVLGENRTEKSVYFGYYTPPLGQRTEKDGMLHTCQSLRMRDDEAFYGMGEQFMDFNKRGLRTEIWNVDPANTMCTRSYKNIPFFISNKGYGVFVNTTRKTIFEMGSHSSGAYTISAEGERLDYFIFLGDTPQEIVGEYYKLTGRPAMVPKWSFGMWFSCIRTYNSQEAMLDKAKEIRAKGFPADVLHIDPPWMDGKDLTSHLEWGDNFPEPQKMLEELHDMGFKISMWTAPYIPLGCKIYKEGLEGDYFVRDAEGELIVNDGPMNYWSQDFVYIDFTNPKAFDWYKNHLIKLHEDGCDIVKNDLGELGALEAKYYNGMDGYEGHNYFTQKYAECVYAAAREAMGDDAMIWCRSGAAGAHKNPVHWAGDVWCNFPNMRGQLRAILGASMSGFVFFSHDIGGFVGEPSPELYIRWYQFGVFTSHSRAHGSYPHEPWDYGDEAVEICRKYTDLRYSLLPHIYSTSTDACIEGYPVVKPMIWDYADDRNVTNIADQYMFCNDFLVAPVFEKEGLREIYLPEGEWLDYETGEIYSGNKWIKTYCELSRMPVFVKQGALIFKTPPKQFIDKNEDTWEDITIEIFPEENGAKTLWMNPNESCDISYSVKNETISVKCDIDIKVEILGDKKYDVIIEK